MGTEAVVSELNDRAREARQTRTPHPLADVVQKWSVPPTEMVGKLPKISCKKCSDAPARHCDNHAKARCDECGNWITTAHVHLDYVGHAEVTRILLTIDLDWTWEPVAFAPDGGPMVRNVNNTAELWIRLTVLGVTRLGVGTCQASKMEASKELIGDALRNAAMRFGVALSLWSKEEWTEDTKDPDHTSSVESEPAPDWTLGQAKGYLLQRLAQHLGVDEDVAKAPAGEWWKEHPDDHGTLNGVTVPQMVPRMVEWVDARMAAAAAESAQGQQ